MRHKLIERASGKEVKSGMRIIDFQNEIWELESFRVSIPPSTGKLTVRKPGVESITREFYPAIFGLHFVEIDEGIDS